jgi:hypothetical protein
MSIKDWCVKLYLTNYEISENGLVNVNDDVFLYDMALAISIPIKFGIVSGKFYCHQNSLTTLNGCPYKVGNDFMCYDNKLKSLKGGPREVGGDFFCHYNELVTLEGSPRVVGGEFICRNNRLTSLEGGPKKIGGYFHCDQNPVYDEFCKYYHYQNYMRSIKLKELLWENIQ